MSIERPPNKITAPNAGIALSFHVEHPWPGVGEFCRSTIMRLVLLFIYVPVIALAMTPREPAPEVYSSLKGRFIVRIDPGKDVKKPTPSSHATARVFEFNARTSDYEPKATFKLENEILPEQVLVSEDGSRIVAIGDWFDRNYEKPVIVIHDGSGAVIKRFHVHELLSSQELQEIRPPKGKIDWLPWKIDVNMMLRSDEILVLRDRIAKGPGKKYDNFFIDLRTFKITKERVE